MADRASLMPPNALPVSRPVDLVDAAQLDAPTEIIRAVKDPMRAPAALLPWLAVERRVTDLWVSGLAEAKLRAVIAAQYGILQHAGTPGGLADALAQLDLGVAYDEWFEYGGEPYHIRLHVAVDGDRPWTEAFDAQVWRTALRYKNRRTAIGEVVLTRTLPEGGPAVAAAQFLRDGIGYALLVPDVAPPAAVPAVGAALLVADAIGYALLVPDVAPGAAVPAVGAALLVADAIGFALLTPDVAPPPSAVSPASALLISETIAYGRAA